VARCFGACGLAPTIMIDEDVHQRVKPPRLRELFAAYRDGGAPTAKKTVKKTKKTVTKKPLKKAAAPGKGRRERVGAR
jgi:(2Fe-2S) ferredoxin